MYFSNEDQSFKASKPHWCHEGMFSARLPPPKRDTEVFPARLAESLAHYKDSSRQVEQEARDNGTADEVDEIAPSLELNSLIPIRARDFNMSIPLPSKAAIKETLERTQRHFQELTNPTHEDTVIVNGRTINVIQKQADPLMPRTASANKKKYVPNNELKTVQPQLRDNAVASHSQKDWQIPAMVSQWKNPNGYTTLQRLQNDTNVVKKGSTDVVNDKFDQLSKALDEADRNARKQLQMKNEERLKLINKTIKNHEVHKTTDHIIIKDEVEADKNNTQVTYDSRLFLKGAVSNNDTQIYDSSVFQTGHISHIYRDPKQQAPVQFTKAVEKDEPK